MQSWQPHCHLHCNCPCRTLTENMFPFISERSNVKSPTEEKDEGPFVDIVTTRGTVSLKDFSLGKDKKKLSLPKIHLEANSEDTENALVRVEQANKSDQSGFSSPRNSTGGRGSEKMSGSGSNQTAVSARLLTKTLVDTISNKRDSLAESVESLKVPSLIDSMNHLKLQRKSQGGKLGNSGHAPAHRKLYLLRGSVYVTFPYVYHSLGEQTCPRYSLFRECTDYDPYANQVDGRKSKMSMASSHRYSNASLKSILSNATSRRNSHVSEGGDSTYPSGSRRGSKRVSFSNIAHVVRAVQDSHP